MLQRHFFSQKRHLESIFAKCKYPTLNLISNASTLPPSIIPRPRQVSPSASTARTTIPVFSAEDPSNVLKYLNFSWTHPEFSRVVDTLLDDPTLEKTLLFIDNSPSLLLFLRQRKKIRQLVKRLAQFKAPFSALKILHLVQRLGYPVDASGYESVAYRFAEAHKWAAVLSVVAQARSDLGHTTLRLLNWRTLALMESQRYTIMRQVPEEFNAAGITPSRRTFNIILSGCLRNNDIEAAKECLRSMEKAGFPVDETTHATVGNLYRNFGVDPEVCQNAIQSLHNLSPDRRTEVVNRLIQSYLDINDLATSKFMLSLFKQTAPLGSTVSWFVEKLDNQEQTVYSLLPVTEVCPNANTVAILMNHLIRKSDYDGAIQLADLTTSTGTALTQNFVVSLTHTYFLRGYGDAAIMLIAKLCKDPHLKELRSLMDGFSDRIHATSMDLSHLTLTARSSNALLRGVLKRRGFGSVPAVFATMHANDVQPNSRTLELLLSYMNKVNVPHARTLLQVLRALLSKNIPPSLKHMHHIVGRIFRDERHKYIRSAWGRRSRQWNTLPLSPFRHLPSRKQIRLLEETDDFDPMAGIALGDHLSYRSAARPVVEMLYSNSVKADSVMTFYRMRRHSVLHVDVQSAHRILRTLMARGMRPNEYHFGSLVEGYSLAGDFRAATAVLKIAQEAGVQANVVMYTSLIAGYARQCDPKSAIRAFEEMLSAGIAPDIASINAVVSAFYAKGEYKEARNVLMKLWIYIAPFPEELRGSDLLTLVSHFCSLNDSPSNRRVLSRIERHAVYDQIRAIIRSYRHYYTRDERHA